MTRWIAGNRVRPAGERRGVLPARVRRASRNAQREVIVETFILFEDKVGLQLHAALLRGGAARRAGRPDGRRLRLARPVAASSSAALTAAGVRVRVFDPGQRALRLARSTCCAACTARSWWSTAQRAFVGGINYSADHLADFGPRPSRTTRSSSQARSWPRSTASCCARSRSAASGTRLVPAPAARQRAAEPNSRRPASAEAHVRDARQPPPHQRHRAPLPRRDPRARASASSSPTPTSSPATGCIKELRRAARRGVDVRLILQGEPDMPIVKIAASMLYHHLLRAGVQHLRVLRAAAARQGRAGRRRMVHGRLEQPRPAEPVAQPRGQRHHPRPRLQPDAVRSASSS